MLYEVITVAVLEANVGVGSEVMASRHLGEVDEVAGMEVLCLFRGPEIHGHLLFHSVAIAGGADARTRAAGKAAFAPFLPDVGLKLHVQYLGEVRRIDCGGEQAVLPIHGLHVV